MLSMSLMKEMNKVIPKIEFIAYYEFTFCELKVMICSIVRSASMQHMSVPAVT